MSEKLTSMTGVLPADGYVAADVMAYSTDPNEKRIDIIVRPKNSSRTFRLTARVEEIREL
jgi:hypothetical protein